MTGMPSLAMRYLWRWRPGDPGVAHLFVNLPFGRSLVITAPVRIEAFIQSAEDRIWPDIRQCQDGRLRPSGYMMMVSKSAMTLCSEQNRCSSRFLPMAAPYWSPRSQRFPEGPSRVAQVFVRRSRSLEVRSGLANQFLKI